MIRRSPRRSDACRCESVAGALQSALGGFRCRPRGRASSVGRGSDVASQSVQARPSGCATRRQRRTVWRHATGALSGAKGTRKANAGRMDTDTESTEGLRTDCCVETDRLRLRRRGKGTAAKGDGRGIWPACADATASENRCTRRDAAHAPARVGATSLGAGAAMMLFVRPRASCDCSNESRRMVPEPPAIDAHLADSLRCNAARRSAAAVDPTDGGERGAGAAAATLTATGSMTPAACISEPVRTVRAHV